MTLKTSFLKRSRNEELMNTVAERIQSDPETITRALEVLAELHNPRKKVDDTTPEGGISMRAGAKKYKVNNVTVKRWVDRGLIPVLDETDNCKYIDENVLRDVAETYKKDPGRGKRTIIKKIKDN
jgi:hypothetical protein